MPGESLRSAGGVEYTLTRKRVKNLNLRLGPDGSVRVSAPARASLAAVDAFVASHAEWVRRAQDRAARAAAERAAIPAPDPAACLALYTEVSDRVFPLFKEVLGGEKPTLKVRDMRTRWGSCHPGKRQITLAARRARQPPPGGGYFVVAAYCHIFDPAHPAGFWAGGGSILPDYRARRALLRNAR